MKRVVAQWVVVLVGFIVFVGTVGLIVGFAGWFFVLLFGLAIFGLGFMVGDIIGLLLGR